MQNKYINIELVYALPHKQELLELEIDDSFSVEQAISQSGLLSQFPEIDLTVNKVGIFGKACKLTDSLREGDRIEIYRPLIADPKEARKKRALKK